ncbi:flippase activity-associated protein Agl23, partial [Spirochaetota bacterium]
SLYAKYCWDYAEKGHHIYDPMMHGPFLFIVNGTLMKIFGSNDFTSRLLPALCGILLVISCIFLKKELGPGGSLVAALFFMLSPHMVYFTRFLRMDAMVLLFTFWIVIAFIKYIQTQDHKRQALYFILCIASLALLYTVKENSYLHTFEFITFLAMIPLYRIIIDRDLTFKELFSNCTKYLKNNWKLLLVSCFIFIVIFTIFYTIVFSQPAALTQRGFFGFFSGSFMQSVNSVIKAWSYWLHQNKIQRIHGEYHYFYWRMIMYEFMMVVGFFIAVYFIFKNKKKELKIYLIFTVVIFILFQAAGRIKLPIYAAMGAKASFGSIKEALGRFNIISVFLSKMHMECLGHPLIFIFVAATGFWGMYILFRKKELLPAFLLYWAMFSMLMYSYLGEKVAWLGLHIYQPMILLVAYYAERWMRKSRYSFAIFIAIGALYMSYCTYGLNFYNKGVNEANPEEIICFTQNHDDLKKLNTIIDKASEISGLGFNTPLAIAGTPAWPYSWYLRNYKRWFTPEGGTPAADALVFAIDWGKHSQYEYIYTGTHNVERLKMRAWTVMPNLDTSKITLWSKIKYLLCRLDRSKVRLANTGSLDIAVYTRKDVAEGIYNSELGKGVQDDELKRRAEAMKPVVIQNTSSFGSFGTGSGKMNEPRKAVRGIDGSIYVTDMKNNMVHKFDRSGNPIKSWGGKGSADGMFNTPIGIEVDKRGNVYVADAWNHRIQKFSSSGVFLMKWGRGGCGSTGNDFWAPKDLAFDSKEYLYVVNTGCHRLHKFDTSGRFIKMQGFQSIKDTSQLSGFHEPVGITIDKNDILYICDTANHRIILYTTDLNPIRQIKVIGWGEFYTEPFIALDSKGRIYISDSYNNRLVRYSNNGDILSVWGRIGSSSGHFNAPHGITIYNDTAYVVDAKNHRVQKFRISDLDVKN